MNTITFEQHIAEHEGYVSVGDRFIMVTIPINEIASLSRSRDFLSEAIYRPSSPIYDPEQPNPIVKKTCVKEAEYTPYVYKLYTKSNKEYEISQKDYEKILKLLDVL